MAEVSMDRVIREKFGLIFFFAGGRGIEPDAEDSDVVVEQFMEQWDEAQHLRQLEHSIICFNHTFKQQFLMDEACSFGFYHV